MNKRTFSMVPNFGYPVECELHEARPGLYVPSCINKVKNRAWQEADIQKIYVE